MVQEIGMTGMLRTGIGGRFIQYFAFTGIAQAKNTYRTCHTLYLKAPKNQNSSSFEVYDLLQ